MSKPPDLIVVYNCCGASGKSNVKEYARNISHLLTQQNVDFELVISVCQNLNTDLLHLNGFFGKRVSWSITQSNHTVNVTFNNACREAMLEFGIPTRGFLYVSSDCDIGGDEHKLKRLVDTHTKANGMTSALVDKDSGLELWRPGVSESELFNNGTYTIPIGQTCNLHFQIFDSALVEAFGHPLPDVFRDHCTESIFSFMCAAIGKRFQMTSNAKVHHEHGMDGGSSGFTGDRGWKNFLPQAIRTAEQVVADPEALECGMGYEECEGVLMHDESLYDDDGTVVNPNRLKNFILNNFFLPASHYAFEPMEFLWIPRGKDMSDYQLPKEPVIPNITEIQNYQNMVQWLGKNGIGTLKVLPWGTQPQDAEHHADYSLDGVFLNVQHDYRVMLEDLCAFWPKVKRLGLMAGADFNRKGYKFEPASVDPRNAIQRFCDEHHVTPHVCADGTWVVLKRW